MIKFCLSLITAYYKNNKQRKIAKMESSPFTLKEYCVDNLMRKYPEMDKEDAEVIYHRVDFLFTNNELISR